jgi:hypothetical protein
MTDKEVMQQALEALEGVYLSLQLPDLLKVVGPITALREALAQPEQEPDRQALQAAGTHPAPCARHCEAKAFEIEIRSLKSALRKALAQPEQEPLTGGEIYTAYITAANQTLRPQDERIAFAFARAIEAAHGIKERNNG